MAKIAVELDRALAERERNGTPAAMTTRVLVEGDGWTVCDVICSAGPHDRPFEERHSSVNIALVVAGTFQYRSSAGSELMTPGSVLLGDADQPFECGHEHGTGDRCLSFSYSAEYFERSMHDSGCYDALADFARTLRVPPLPALSPLLAQGCYALTESAVIPWEELGVQLAGLTLRLVKGLSGAPLPSAPDAVARVTRAVRYIERHPETRLSLGQLARRSGLSPYHFLRTFERLTGVTPHQYILRARLREAALRLAAEPTRILDVALDSGFGDVSNFNRTFRAEFGMSPRAYRRRASEAPLPSPRP